MKQQRNKTALTLSKEYKPMARDHGCLRKKQETQHKHETPRRPVPPYDGRMCEGIFREKGHLEIHYTLSKATGLPGHRSSTVQTADRGTSATVQCYSVCSIGQEACPALHGEQSGNYPGRQCELGRGE